MIALSSYLLERGSLFGPSGTLETQVQTACPCLTPGAAAGRHSSACTREEEGPSHPRLGAAAEDIGRTLWMSWVHEFLAVVCWCQALPEGSIWCGAGGKRQLPYDDGSQLGRFLFGGSGIFRSGRLGGGAIDKGLYLK